jgi:hypothetical protein
VDEVALGLLAMGVGKGERVGIWAPSCAEWVLTQHATAKIGAIVVNINPAYRAYELDYVVRQSGLRLMVSAVAHRTSDYRVTLAGIGFEATVFIGEPSWDDLVSAGRQVDPVHELGRPSIVSALFAGESVAAAGQGLAPNAWVINILSGIAATTVASAALVLLLVRMAHRRRGVTTPISRRPEKRVSRAGARALATRR